MSFSTTFLYLNAKLLREYIHLEFLVNEKKTDVSNILIYIFIEMNPIIHYLGFLMYVLY